MRAKSSLISLVALFSLTSASAFGTHVKGMINGRSGEKFTVKSDHGDVTVLLTDGTTTRDETGLFGLGNEKMGPICLYPDSRWTSRKSNGQGLFIKSEDYRRWRRPGNERDDRGRHPTPTAKQVEANIEAINVNKRAIEINRQTSSANAAEIAALKDELAALKAGLAELSESHEVNRRLRQTSMTPRRPRFGF